MRRNFIAPYGPETVAVTTVAIASGSQSTTTPIGATGSATKISARVMNAEMKAAQSMLSASDDVARVNAQAAARQAQASANNVLATESSRAAVAGETTVAAELPSSGTGVRLALAPPQKAMNVGDSGHHVPAVRKAQGRSFEVSRADKDRPTVFPLADDPAHAHWRLHDAERAHVRPRQGSFQGSDQELMDAYRKAYEKLDDMLVGVRSPSGKYNLGDAVTPREAVDLVQRWLKENGLWME